jgi:hypothetical protein
MLHGKGDKSLNNSFPGHETISPATAYHFQTSGDERMTKRYALWLVLAAFFFGSGAQARDLVLEHYFKGRTYAHGSFSAITGTKRSFDVALTGIVKGRTLTLVEDFVYNDGEKSRKTWVFVRQADGTYRGTRDDVIGETRITIKGNTARYTYLIDLDEGPGQQIVRFYDQMVLSADGKRIVNTATVTKFGFPVAKVKVDFRR